MVEVSDSRVERIEGIEASHRSPYSYGLHGYGLYSYGQYMYGLYSYGP